MQFLIGQAGKQGVRALSLSVELDNPALKLYMKLGFERFDQLGNALTMVKYMTCGEVALVSAEQAHLTDEKEFE